MLLVGILNKKPRICPFKVKKLCKLANDDPDRRESAKNESGRASDGLEDSDINLKQW